MNSSPQIFLHVGMHKTATTSIQKFVFAEADKVHITYLGVGHPRVGGSSPFHELFMRLVTRSSSKEFWKDIELMDQLLDSHIVASDLPLLLSDENIYCSRDVSGKLPLDERVKRIGRIFRNRNLKIIATVRPQPQLLFSLYVEVYPFLNSPRPTFGEFWSNPDLLSAYQYDRLFERFSSLECCREIAFIDFKRLNQGETDKLCDFIGVPRCDLGHLNVRSENMDTKYAEATVAEVALRKNLRLAATLKKYPFTYRLGMTLYALLDKFGLKSMPISKPDQELMRSVSDYFADSNVRFRNLSGIDYATRT